MRLGAPDSFGGHSGGGTPLPIPNREVKPVSADGTRRATSRESRSPPIFFESGPTGPFSWIYAASTRSFQSGSSTRSGDALGRVGASRRAPQAPRLRTGSRHRAAPTRDCRRRRRARSPARDGAAHRPEPCGDSLSSRRQRPPSARGGATQPVDGRRCDRAEYESSPR